MPTASLTFFYFGEDSYLRTLAQETVALHHAVEGYDRAIVLKHDTDAGPFEMSKRAEEAADVVDLPTRANLVKYLNELAGSGHVTDLFIFSHGLSGRFLCSNGAFGDNGWVTDRYLQNSVLPLHLRAVWGCNCYGSSLNPTWLGLGAKVCAGARYVNFYPTRWAGFIKRWKDGERFGAAVYRSDTALVHSPAQAFMLADAASRPKAWDGGTVEALAVLGKNPSAERYFTRCWIQPEQWQPDKSGKQNMNHSSKMMIMGERTTTNAMRLSWIGR